MGKALLVMCTLLQNQEYGKDTADFAVSIIVMPVGCNFETDNSIMQKRCCPSQWIRKALIYRAELRVADLLDQCKGGSSASRAARFDLSLLRWLHGVPRPLPSRSPMADTDSSLSSSC